MACGQCGVENRDDARFCSGCGSALSLVCSSCGREMAPEARFCDLCGTAVGAPAPAPATAPTPAAPGEAVRKTVTVMFCDLGGSTGFGERVDPETARTVMARYYALLQEAMDLHRGTIAKFTGDGLMAIFGIPEVAEDDAARAVAAGAEMQARFHAFAADVEDRFGETLTFRVGINTGEVVIAEGDADLVGDALNVAARLEKACAPGRVLVGEETWRLTRGDLAYEALGEVTVSGRAEPVAIYQLAAESSVEIDTATPFVGREDELARLQVAFDDAVARNEARFVSVLGSPGVGKTRLSRELAATAKTATTFEVRCDRAGEATFAPIVELIRAAVDLGDGLDAAFTRERLATLIPADGSERDRIIDGLAGIVGSAPARSTEEAFWSVRRLVESMASEQPVILVIDDIQWAESLLLDLLEHLAEWVRDAPFLLVGLARPELREIRPVLTEAGRRMADVLALDGLDSAATEQLAARLLGTDRLPVELVARLPESTDGNPLFVRELVRMLVDDQVIQRRGDAWELAIDADAVEVPPTIQSLLAARVERLADDERTVLELASVIGAEFSLGALRELVGPDGRATLDTRLERLRRKELVEPTGTYWGDEPLHRFHHVLIRDAAYRRLLKGTRAELHEQVGRWTDEAAAHVIGEHEAVIAFHYEQAHEYRRQLGPLDDHGRALGRRAAELLTLAAQGALERDDLAAAGSLASRAIDRLDANDHDDRAALLLLACEALVSSGDVAAARPLVEDLSGMAVGDPRLEAWAACFDAQMIVLTDPDRLVDAEAITTRAAASLAELGDGAGEAKAHLVRARTLAGLGRVADCEIELDRALSAARTAADRRRVIAVLGAAPTAALWGPSPVARAGGRCLDVVRLLRITSASPAVEATSLRCQAVLEALRGRIDTARSMLSRARTTLEELGLQHDLMETELFAGIVELIGDDPAAAEAPLRAAYGGLGAMGVGADAGQAAALLARSLLAQGREDEADEMATASEALAGQNLKPVIAWRSARAAMLAARGDTTAAVALAEEAVRIAAGTDLVLDHADACIALASVRAEAGDERGAADARADAARLYTAKGATVLAERAGTSPSIATSRASVPVDREVDGSENLASRQARLSAAAWQSGDVEDARSFFVPDFELHDRRAGLQTALVGFEQHAEHLRVIVDMLGDDAFEVHEVIAQRGDYLTLVREGVDGNFQIETLALIEVDSVGRNRYCCIFDVDDHEAAMAELDARYAAELATAGASGAWDDTSAVRAGREFAALCSGRAFDDLRSMLDDDFVRVDNRAGLRSTIVGPDAYVDAVRASFGAYNHGRRWTTVAVRGDRVALGRMEVRLDGGWEIEYLGLYECDANGQFTRATYYDDADLLDAVEVLEHWYVEGEGATHARWVEAGRRYHVAFNQRDWEEVEASLSPDLAGVDHRELGWETSHGRAAWLARDQGQVEVMPTVQNLARCYEFLGDVVLTHAVSFGTTDDGNVYEWEFWAPCLLDDQGRVARIELFGPEGRDAARARAEELGRPPTEGSARPVENALTRMVVHGGSLSLDEMRDHLSRHVADDFVREDRRRGAQAPVTHTREEFVDVVRAMFAVGFDRATHVPVAVRGERVAVIRLEWQTDGGDLLSFLQVWEADEGHQATRLALFDDDNLVDALELLEDWYLEGEGAQHAAWVDATRRYDRAFNQRDWLAVEDTLAPDLVFVDHRQIGHGVLDGRAAYLAGVPALLEVMPTGERICRSVEFLGAVALSCVELHGATEEGNVYEWAWCSVSLIDEQGRLSRIETFGPDEYAAARARAIELGRPSIPTSELANGATRTMAEFRRIFDDRDWPAFPGILHESVRADDHRSTTRGEGATGVHEEVALVQSLADVGFERLVLTPLAVRGDTLALYRNEWVTPDGYVLTTLNVAKCDADGLLLRTYTLDADALAEAYRVLDEWYVAGEGAAFAGFLEFLMQTFELYNRGDWDALKAHYLMSPSFVVVGHRLAGWGRLEGGANADYQRSLGELSLDVTVGVVEYLELASDLAIYHWRTEGHSLDGGAFVIDLLMCAALRPDRSWHAEVYDRDDEDAARARWVELRAELDAEVGSPSVLANRATQRLRPFADAFRARDWVAIRSFISDRVVQEDRRSTVRAPGTTDADEFASNIQGLADVGFTSLEPTTLAIRGVNLMLNRYEWSHPDGFTLETLNLGEVGIDGRAIRNCTLDPDALAEAYRLLDEWYLEGEGVEWAEVLEPLVQAIACYNARDWEGLRRVRHGVPMTTIDHRLAGWGRLEGGDALTDLQQSLGELAADITVGIVEYVELAADLGIYRWRTEGHSVDGGAFVMEMLMCSAVMPDGSVRTEVFDGDDLVGARARWIELRQELDR